VKITKRQLKRIIKEEKVKILKEYEQYVDEDGNVYDDEGNVDRRGSAFGRKYGGETYTGTKQPWNRRQGRGVPPMPGSVRGKQLVAIEAHLANKPNKFLQSLVDQMNSGKSLSKKQESVMNKIMRKADPSNANLFEGKIKITKRQLRRIIKEEKSNLLKENPDLPEELQGKSDEELEDKYAEMLMSGTGDKDTLDALKAHLDSKDAGVNETRRRKMRISKRQLKRIIKEEKAKLLGEDEAAPSSESHHWPRVDWTNIETLTDKWAQAERDAWDKGDSSMMLDKPGEKSQAEWDKEMQSRWESQVEEAAMDFEAELTARIREISLSTMKEFTDKLIGGEYL
jgi:hypothetical protein